MPNRPISEFRSLLPPIYEDSPLIEMPLAVDSTGYQLIQTDPSDLDIRVSCARKRVVFFLIALSCSSIATASFLAAQQRDILVSKVGIHTQKILEVCFISTGIASVVLAIITLWKSCRSSEQV